MGLGAFRDGCGLGWCGGSRCRAVGGGGGTGGTGWGTKGLGGGSRGKGKGEDGGKGGFFVRCVGLWL